MKYSYTVDSNGVIAEAGEKAIHLLRPDSRLQELDAVTEELLPYFLDYGVTADYSTFDYMIQPLYTEDRLLFFSKIQLDPADKIVRTSFMSQQNPAYQYADKAEEEALKSIFSVQDKNRTLWYMLQAEALILERNLHDGAYISITQTAPVPYYRFMQDRQRIQITAEELQKGALCGKYSIISPYERDCANIEAVAQTAVVRDKLPQGQPAQLDKILYRIAKDYAEQSGIAEKDPNSNRKMQCLHQINDSRNEARDIFRLYSELKWYLKHQFPGTNGICYKNNTVYFRIPDRERGVVYITNAANEQFISGGQTIRGMEKLKETIADGSCFQKQDWFDDIQPYIKEKGNSKTKG